MFWKERRKKEEFFFYLRAHIGPFVLIIYPKVQISQKPVDKIHDFKLHFTSEPFMVEGKYFIQCILVY